MRTTWRGCMALAVVLSLHFGITPPHIMAADTCEEAKAHIKNRGTIELFMDCLNTCVPADVSEAIQCLPDKCLITVTMSPQSAQRACTLGGCQLPRIILDCPGPADGLRFRPSFLLCPVDSKGAGDHFGKDRIEIGEDNRKLDRPIRTAFGTGTVDMKMADVPILPNNNYVSMDLEDVLSLKSGGGNVGSKGCNNCHNPNGTTMVTDMFGQTLEAQLSLDISAFGVFIEGLAQYTIGTNDPIERMLRIGPGMTTKGSDGMLLQPVDVVRQGLSPICDCIKDPDKQTAIIADNDNRRNFPKNQSGRGLGDGTPNPDMRTEIGVMTRLCDALQAYTTGPRGIGNSSACGTAPGTSCSGVAGGGKFLQQGTAAVSILSLQVKGEVVHDSASAFSFTDIDGDVSAFDYGTRTYINPVHLSSLSGILSGSGDLVVTGAGVASVNGVSTNIHLNAAKMNGVVTFQILNADTGMPLAGGTGESELARLDFITSAP